MFFCRGGFDVEAIDAGSLRIYSPGFEAACNVGHGLCVESPLRHITLNTRCFVRACFSGWLLYDRIPCPSLPASSTDSEVRRTLTLGYDKTPASTLCCVEHRPSGSHHVTIRFLDSYRRRFPVGTAGTGCVAKRTGDSGDDWRAAGHHSSMVRGLRLQCLHSQAAGLATAGHHDDDAHRLDCASAQPVDSAKWPATWCHNRFACVRVDRLARRGFRNSGTIAIRFGCAPPNRLHWRCRHQRGHPITADRGDTCMGRPSKGVADHE